jgi:hypothetical protein
MDERLDLKALELSVVERERLVASILTRAAPELARRGADVSPILLLSQWVRPALAAAAVVAAVCMSVLAQPDFADTVARTGLAEALNVPSPAAEWVATDRAPTLDDLLLAMESEGR